MALRTSERLMRRVRTMALRTLERLWLRDLSWPHNSGLENVGKAEATRSESAT